MLDSFTRKKKVLAAWIIALILLVGTIAFIIIYTRAKPNDKYAFLNRSILQIIKNNKWSSDKFNADVASKVENHFAIYDLQKSEVKKSKVMYEITSNSGGNIGYIIQFLNNEKLVSHVLNFTFNSSGIICDVNFVV